MPSATAKFATGKYALGICDICGVRYLLSELRGTTIRGKPTGLLVCPIDFDNDHPQNFLSDAIHIDAEALRNPRPEDYYSSRILPHWRPCDALPVTLSLGDVEVLTA
jgi:hypothetical protein